jgi:hypothetical protein
LLLFPVAFDFALESRCTESTAVGYIRPDETAGTDSGPSVTSTNYDCVVIGGGVRLPPRPLCIIRNRHQRYS